MKNKKSFLAIIFMLIVTAGFSQVTNCDLTQNLPNGTNTGFEYKFLYNSSNDNGVLNCINASGTAGTSYNWGDVFAAGPPTGFKNGYEVVYNNTTKKFTIKTDGTNNAGSVMYVRLPIGNCGGYDGATNKLDLSANRTIQVRAKSNQSVNFEIFLCVNNGTFDFIDGNAGDPRTVTALTAGQKRAFTITNPTHKSDNSDQSAYLTKVLGFGIKISGNVATDIEVDFIRLGVLTNASQDCNGTACTNPTVSITAPTTGSSYAFGTGINFTSTATDPDGTIAKVQYYEGTTLLGEVTSSPYTLNYSSLGIGAHTITAVAIDDEANTTTSSSISVTITNQNPTVSITNPTSGASFISGNTVTLDATAADADGTVSKVEFYDGATLLFQDLSSPYTYSTTTLTVGSHNITAVATDNASTTTTSSIVVVTITGPNQSPTVSISSPSTGASFVQAGTVTINAIAADADGTVSKVEFYDGASLLGQSTTSPYSFSTSTLALGAHTITAKAYDNQSATTVSTSVSITIVLASSNQNPTVSITSPATGTSFVQGATVSIDATAADADGTVAKVEFYDGSTKIGEDLTNPYNFSTTSLSAGAHSITAKAIDNQAGTTTSSSVSLTITTATSVNEAEAANALLKVYPNPAREQITVDLSALPSSEAVALKLISPEGRVVLEENTSSKTYKMNVSSLNKGLYHIEIQSADGKKYNKNLVIE